MRLLGAHRGRPRLARREFAAVDILPDPRIRQELSAISNWPTIPQLFVKGELVGGSDIVTEMYECGELARCSASSSRPRSRSRTASPSVAVIHHLQQPFLGHAAHALRDVELVEHFGTLPSLDDVDGIVSLGGEDSVLDGGLEAEAELLRQAVGRDIPVLGVCLGAQLLAHALGGRVVRRPRRLVAWTALRGEWDGYGLHWNEDAFEPPPGAVEVLARPDGCGEAFRVGRAVGVQFHPEVDGAALDGWYAAWGDVLAPAGVEEAAVRAADARHLPGQAGVASRSSAAGRGARCLSLTSSPTCAPRSRGRRRACWRSARATGRSPPRCARPATRSSPSTRPGRSPSCPSRCMDYEAPPRSFDAAVAVVSLHHVCRWAARCARSRDCSSAARCSWSTSSTAGRYDERTAAWWFSHSGHDSTPAEQVAMLREHVHPLAAIREALSAWFDVGLPVPGPYLYRFKLDPALRSEEEALIASGEIVATGARFVAVRR